MFTNIILGLGDLIEFLLSVNVHSKNGLCQVGLALVFIERGLGEGSHIYFNNTIVYFKKREIIISFQPNL